MEALPICIILFSKDKKTSIMVSFMNLNESEYSTVTIAYQKEF